MNVVCIRKTSKKLPLTLSYFFSKIDHKITQWGSGNIKIYISKDVPRDWQLTVQYSVPIKIGAIWGGGRKSGQNEGGETINLYVSMLEKKVI